MCNSLDLKNKSKAILSFRYMLVIIESSLGSVNPIKRGISLLFQATKGSNLTLINIQVTLIVIFKI